MRTQIRYIGATRTGERMSFSKFKQEENKMRTQMRYIGVMIVMLIAVVAGVNPTWAATNQAIDGGGGSITLSSSGTVTVNSLSLGIVKEARLLDGTLLSSPVSLPSGTKFYFVLYVDNTTDVALNDIRMVDTIAQGAGNFTVDTATFQILNTVAAPGIDMTAGNLAAWAGSAAWNALTWNALTSAADADQLDYGISAANRVTIGRSGANNALLAIIASGQANKVTNPHRAAFRFQVTLNP